jgi:predicted NUDIX family NTP pyrophosphohydrolase
MKTSAGLLLFRERQHRLEVYLIHPGGPFFVHKDEGAWSIPKGEIETGEDSLAAAKREFAEETGSTVDGDFIALTPVRQSSGKTVHAWAVEGDADPATLVSNTFVHHGREYPEVDRAAWFTLDEARRKILKGQAPLLDELARLRGSSPAGTP